MQNKVKHKKRNLFILDSEAEIIYKEAAQYSQTMKIMVGFALFRGMRISEIRKLKIQNFKNEQFSQIEFQLSKSKIIDDFPIIKQFSIELEKYVKDNTFRMIDGFLFPGKNGGPMKKSSAIWKFYKFRIKLAAKFPQFLEKANYESGYIRNRVGWHSMRRWFETRLLLKGYTTFQVADIMRYSSEKTVRTYWNSYLTWMNERKMLENTFGDFFGHVSNISKGQTFLSDFTSDKNKLVN